MIKTVIIFLLIVIVPGFGGCVDGEKKSSIQVQGNSTRDILLREFRSWEGTPHKMGGNSKKGIDCSGFAHYMYEKLFNINVPRSTKLFLKAGHRIKKSNLRPGDIVIFSPPTYPRHVGIYVGDNKFIHASTTRGVMMSDLNNPYWLKYYLMSRRVIR